jgi:hypothetical protein
MKKYNIPVMAKFFENLTDETKIVDIQYKIKANDLFSKFQTFLKDYNFKNEITSTRFGIDIKEYEGVVKTKTNKGAFYIVNFDKIKEHLTSKYKMEFIIDDFDDEIDETDNDTEEN